MHPGAGDGNAGMQGEAVHMEGQRACGKSLYFLLHFLVKLKTALKSKLYLKNHATKICAFQRI